MAKKKTVADGERPDASQERPDPEIDRVWAEEARKRWQAYKAGRVSATPYETVMAKHRCS